MPCRGNLEPSIPHPYLEGDKLFLFMDTIHYFKNIYNNWVNKKILQLPVTDLIDPDKKIVANFHQIEKLYNAESTKTLRIAHKLTSTTVVCAPPVYSACHLVMC